MPEGADSRPIDEARGRAGRRIAYSLLALGVVAGYGVVGYVAMGWSPFDALYMVVITVATVGYGEVRPIDTAALRVHTMLLIAFGTVTLTYTVAAVLQLLTEGEIQRILGHQRVKRQIEGLKGHIIVVGMGRMGALIASELARAGAPFVVVDRAAERAAELEGNDWPYVIGDATEEGVLRDAGLERAAALVTAIPSDAISVFITLTARQMAPEVRILARAEQPSTEKKLMQAGADHVVLPASIGAHRAVYTLLNPGAVQFTELLNRTTGLAFEIAEVPVEPGSPFAGRTLRDADVARRTGAMVIAIRRDDGRVDFPPGADEPLAIGDLILVLGRREQLDRFRQHFPHA